MAGSISRVSASSAMSCRPDSGRWLYKYNWANRQHHPLPVFGNPTLPIEMARSTGISPLQVGSENDGRNTAYVGAKHAMEFKERNLIARERMELPERTLKLLEISKRNTENGHASVKPVFGDFDLHTLNLSVHFVKFGSNIHFPNTWPNPLYAY